METWKAEFKGKLTSFKHGPHIINNVIRTLVSLASSHQKRNQIYGQLEAPSSPLIKRILYDSGIYNLLNTT